MFYHYDKILLFLDVDDIAVTGDDTDGISSLNVHLQKKFHMKDLGHL